MLILLGARVGSGRVILSVRASPFKLVGSSYSKSLERRGGVEGWILKHLIKVSALSRGGVDLKGGVELSVIPGKGGRGGGRERCVY